MRSYWTFIQSCFAFENSQRSKLSQLNGGRCLIHVENVTIFVEITRRFNIDQLQAMDYNLKNMVTKTEDTGQTKLLVDFLDGFKTQV